MAAATELLQTVHLEHLPPGYDIHVGLWHGISNAGYLHEQLLAGNQDFEYAFVDASVVVSRTHILAAAYRAVNDLLENRLKSRNVHSEIVLCLSPSNNIAESFRRFGITPASASVLAIKVSTPQKTFTNAQVQSHLSASIQGTQVVLEDAELAKATDLTKVKKYYKLNSGGGGGGKKQPSGVNGHAAKREVDERRELEVQVLGAMALRGAS